MDPAEAAATVVTFGQARRFYLNLNLVAGIFEPDLQLRLVQLGKFTSLNKTRCVILLTGMGQHHRDAAIQLISKLASMPPTGAGPSELFSRIEAELARWVSRISQ